MTQTGYANAVVNVMLGWLKGLANWVLKLFNLAGSGGNPLLWLSENWLKLLILLLVAGVAIDWLVWMIRWRPYWVWFKKKRIIVNDERILRGEELDEEDFEAMMEKEYEVPSTLVRRKKGAKRPAQPVQRTTQRKRTAPSPVAKRPERKAISSDDMNDDLFEVGHDQQEYSDFYEDEVFNVSNLPEAQETKKIRKRRK